MMSGEYNFMRVIVSWSESNPIHIPIYEQTDRGVYVAKVKPPRGSQSSSSLEGRDENRPADLHVDAILGETSTQRIIYY
ncbi:unnamed protein product [Macrosiphum euphorbiae]|uniref:Uncharacterized protein n=1 Tax=Macrosiphum euphorbiae TaxID=13131 RepID=A0AAV0W3L8_9HEMI|nr:unnamed protein product [Macrosiphum euphorbiae]